MPKKRIKSLSPPKSKNPSLLEATISKMITPKPKPKRTVDAVTGPKHSRKGDFWDDAEGGKRKPYDPR